jgi:hypothetical protein
MITAILVPVEGNPSIVQTEQDFPTLYKLINCEIIQVVGTMIGSKRVNIVCDEEGLLNKKKKNSCMIVGDFLIVGLINDEQFISVEDPEYLLHMINQYKGIRTEVRKSDICNCPCHNQLTVQHFEDCCKYCQYCRKRILIGYFETHQNVCANR